MPPESLFQPFRLKSLALKNRIVMAPMTRCFSPGGVPTPEVAAYYRRRTEGNVGLILTEGTVVNRPASSNEPNVPRFHGDRALAAWKHVVEEVHAAGGSIAPQLWHMGIMEPHASGWLPPSPFEGPSGVVKPDEIGGVAMTGDDIATTIRAFAQAAADAKSLGFDAVEIHAAHGYLIDQFFWAATNSRRDAYGGTRLRERTRFATEIIRAVRTAVGADFAILVRLSQFKLQDYNARLAQTPDELRDWLEPLAEAGADIFHCSQRRFWEPEFPGSDLNFAGWAKKLTGKPSVTVGSVGLSGEFLAAFAGERSAPCALDELSGRLQQGDFDLVAVGRALLADPEWAQKVAHDRAAEFIGFKKEALATLH